LNLSYKYYLFLSAAARRRDSKRPAECGPKRGRNSLKKLDRAGKNAGTAAAPLTNANSVVTATETWSAGAQRTSGRVKGLRIDPVLLFQDTRRKGGGVVRRENWHTRLG
jgi:hypothetical protein